MVFIIHGATGAQGSPVLTALNSAGTRAIAAVRDTSTLPSGVDGIPIDLADEESLAAAYAGAEGVFVHLPMGTVDDALAQANAVAGAIATARPDRVVISASGQIVDQPGTALQAPGDGPIQTLIRHVSESGVSTAVVAPRLYLENLLLPMIAGPAREDGVLRYPLPESFPVSWSSHLDVAEVVVRLLTDPTVTGTVAVGHQPGLTGPSLAAGFTAHLGREVRFEAITPDAFGELIAPMFGPAAEPVVGLYRLLNAQEGNTISSENSAQTLLGLSPRPIAQWLADIEV